MKNLKWIFLLCILTIMLTGCPYGSDVPIDKPGIKINSALLGKWEPKSSTDETYTVTKADDYTYKIEKKGGGPKDKTEEYTAYLSEIDTAVFLNLTDPENREKAYYFYKVELNPSGSKVVLRAVTDNIRETFTKSEDLKAFFKKYQSLSFFFGKDSTVLLKN